MKVSIRLTMDGLKRSLTAIAHAMADDIEWRYAGDGEHAGRAGAAAERDKAETKRHELGGG